MSNEPRFAAVETVTHCQLSTLLISYDLSSFTEDNSTQHTHEFKQRLSSITRACIWLLLQIIENLIHYFKKQKPKEENQK